MAVNDYKSIVAMVPLEDQEIEFFDLDTDTPLNKFTGKSSILKWILFSPHVDEFYSCQ